jgi:quinoprotein glucose dehydrogenase
MFPVRPVARGVIAGCLVIAGAAFAADIDKPKDAASPTNGFRPLVKDDRPQEPVLAPASKEGETRIKQFKLAPGLKVDLWAAEPMLANPVAFAIDERGRVFTSETYRYRSSVLDIRHYMFMLEDDLASRSIDDRMVQIRKWFGPEGEAALRRETEVIRLLEDTDGDHRADKSSVFADNFRSPLSGIASGILARHGEVWLTEIPSLWRIAPSNRVEVPAVPNGPSGDSGAAPAENLKPKTSNSLSSTPRVADGHTATELLRGFGVRFSFTGHDLHGLKMGPDGRLYFSCGDRGARIETREGTVIELPDEGAVFRCEPDGSNLEVVHRGLRNPQELAFNEYGDLFTGDNDSDQGDRERWVQVVEGGDSGWRVGHQHAPLGNAGMWNMERLWVPHFEGQAAYIIPPIANIGDGPSGLAYDCGASLPGDLRGRYLLAYFKGTSAKSGVYSLKLRPAGASYDLVAHDEFVWNSLVPDVDFAPDGAILFADWHEGWPKSNKGRLYRAWFPDVIADPVVRETAKLLGEGFAKRSEKNLLDLLGHRDMRVRQEAQFELAGRGLKSFPGLKQVAFESKNQFARIHALWGIGQIARTVAPSQFVSELAGLVPLLEGGDAVVGATAADVLSAARCANASNHLIGLLGHSSDRVRYFSALGLGRLWSHPFQWRYHESLPEKAASKAASSLKGVVPAAATEIDARYASQLVDPNAALARMVATNSTLSHPLRHAATLALSTRTSMPAHALGYANGFIRSWPGVRNLRLVSLLGWRRLANGELAAFLSDPDPLLVLEAARAINDVPITNALPPLAALAEPAKLDALLKQFATLPAENSKLTTENSETIRDVRADQPLPWTNAPIDHLTPMLLRVVNANFRVGDAAATRRLADLAVRTDLPELIRTEALFALGSWAKPHRRDRIVGTFRPLPERDPAPAAEALKGVLGKMFTSSSEGILTAAAEAIARLELEDAAPRLDAVVRNTSAPAGARSAALRAFARVVTNRSDTGVLVAFAANDSSENLRLAASKLSAELNPGDAAGPLRAKLEGGSIAEQQSAYASLGELKSDAADALLADALDRLMKREVPNEVMLDLVDAAGKRASDAVKSRLAAYQDWKLPKDHLTPYRETLFGGDAERGRKLFYEHAAVACTRCHQIGTDSGGNAGPKLDHLASRVTREHLLESIVFPNRAIAEGYESSMITTKSGGVYAGVVKLEDATSLTVATPDEGDVKVAKAEITSRERGVSGMPEGFGDLLSRFEVRDIVEFLGTLK